jgi:hypothetical protein
VVAVVLDEGKSDSSEISKGKNKKGKIKYEEGAKSKLGQKTAKT